MADADDDYCGDLYLDGKKIDGDVCGWQSYYDDETGCLYYLTDVDDGSATLKCWDGKKTSKISDDVSFYTVADDGQVFYLTDYNFDKYRGDLYSWNGKKSTKIDEDVVNVCIVSNKRD